MHIYKDSVLSYIKKKFSPFSFSYSPPHAHVYFIIAFSNTDESNEIGIAWSSNYHSSVFFKQPATKPEAKLVIILLQSTHQSNVTIFTALKTSFEQPCRYFVSSLASINAHTGTFHCLRPLSVPIVRHYLISCTHWSTLRNISFACKNCQPIETMFIV